MSKISPELRALEIPDRAVFESGQGGLPRLAITSPLAEAHIYLHGAHVTHFQPAGAAPLLFMSERSAFAARKPIRGGVPIAFPWFGARAGDPKAPSHGFARTKEWQVESLSIVGENIAVAFRLDADTETRAVWPHDFILRNFVTIGRQLRITLDVENTSPEPFAFEAALHTYFAVEDVREASITGLEGASYLDKADALLPKTQPAEPIRIVAETDRLFPDNQSACILADDRAGHRIAVEKSGSSTTVVWNPWIAKAAALPDFGADEWPRMLCIETANTGPNTITLAPGARHAMAALISLAD